MDTPICDFVTNYIENSALRLHMPGHKGKSFLGQEKRDITEIDGADVLYQATGIIRRSEENAAALFGTAQTVYSAEGSSLSIRAMLYLVMLYGKKCGKHPRIAAGRNAHKTFLTAAALLDFEIAWIFPQNQTDILSCTITDKELDAFLSKQEEKPIAVYLTSPDYLGNLSDIQGLSKICRKHHVLLVVDNAHGAYLSFLPQSCHPISLGADICCDSAHKTLPVLTGGAYLHISKNAPEWLCEQAESAMSLFASTSPSYLILQSLDLANRYLANGYRERLAAFSEKLAVLKKHLTDAGYTLAGTEPLKLTVMPKSYGYTGIELAEFLLAQNIVCEFSDPDYTVMMLTPENEDSVFDTVAKALLTLKRKPAVTEKMPFLPQPISRLSPKEALFSVSRKLPLPECLGKILASPSVSCPPAVPIVVCGEVIDENAIRVMEYYRIKTCLVVTEP